jgi:hypothetical protein
MTLSSHSELTRPQKHARAAVLGLVTVALAALAVVRPESVPHWVPFSTSCGAITGLPCIFCGTTRAVHHLLHGEFARALYYNWLSFPLTAAAFALIFVLAGELISRRDLLARLPHPHPTRRSLGPLAAAFVLLWCLQVYLAVSQHKTQLLNPDGPLYSLVIGGSQ